MRDYKIFYRRKGYQRGREGPSGSDCWYQDTGFGAIHCWFKRAGEPHLIHRVSVEYMHSDELPEDLVWVAEVGSTTPITEDTFVDVGL